MKNKRVVKKDERVVKKVIQFFICLCYRRYQHC